MLLCKLYFERRCSQRTILSHFSPPVIQFQMRHNLLTRKLLGRFFTLLRSAPPCCAPRLPGRTIIFSEFHFSLRVLILRGPVQHPSNRVPQVGGGGDNVSLGAIPEDTSGPATMPYPVDIRNNVKSLRSTEDNHHLSYVYTGACLLYIDMLLAIPTRLPVCLHA